jgi:hypothetical protein
MGDISAESNGAVGGVSPRVSGITKGYWSAGPGLLAKASAVKEAIVLVGSACGFVGSVASLLWNAARSAGAPSAPSLNLVEAAELFADRYLPWLTACEGAFILLLWVFLSRRPSELADEDILRMVRQADMKPEKIGDATRDARKFRLYYECLLGSWMLFYFVLWLAHARYGHPVDGAHVRLHLLLTGANVASAVCLAQCYLTLGGHARFGPRARVRGAEDGAAHELGAREKAPIAIGLIVVALAFIASTGTFEAYLTSDQVAKLFGFASGLGNAVAMGLLAGRIASPALGGGPFMAMGLQLYAAIQPVFGLFLDEPLTEFLSIAVAIPLKGIMFWILSRAIRDGSLVCLLYAARGRQREDCAIHQTAAAAQGSTVGP